MHEPRLAFQVFHGPTTFARGPVVATLLPEAALDVDAAAVERARQQLLARAPRWLDVLPELRWVDPAQGAALLASHAARGLLNARRGGVLDAGAARLPQGQLRLWVGFHDATLAARALELALRVVRDAARGAATQPARSDAATESEIESLLVACQRAHPDYLARILMLAARARGVPVHPSPYRGRSWQYGWGHRARLFVEAAPLHESVAGREVGRSKVLTHELLASLGFPVTRQRTAATLADARSAAAELGWPVVVKPADAGRGRGVHTRIGGDAHLQRAFADARQHSSQAIVVEAQHEGEDHRLLVVRGRLVAATGRRPPEVTGDGGHSVAQLVDVLNAARAADPVLDRYLHAVQRDAVIDEHLRGQGLDWHAVPAAGRRVALRGNANVSTGGTPMNLLPRVHPLVRQLAEAVAGAVGLDVIGIDYLCTDIALAPADSGGVVIEVNPLPGLDLHVADGGFSEEALGALILGEGPGPIPVIVVVDDDAPRRSALAQCLATPHDAGLGVVSAQLAVLGGLPLAPPPATVGARASHMLALNTCTTLVVLACTQEIAEQGFPVERCALTLWSAANRGRWRAPALETAQRCSDSCVAIETSPDADAAPMAQTVARITDAASAWRADPASAYPRGAPWVRPLPPEAALHCARAHAASRGMSLAVLVRNERRLLPHFLAHYRALGVSNFHVLDEGSDDGSRELLLAQEDVSLWQSPCAYNELLANGERFHHHVLGRLVEAAAAAAVDGNAWVLVVDADEFLVLPTRFAGLLGPGGLVEHLEREGQRCVLAAMVDTYPRRLADASRDAGDPLQACPWFDAGRVFERDAAAGPGGRVLPRKRPAGVRWRLQQMLRERQPAVHAAIFDDQGYDMPALWKTPLVRAGAGLYWRDGHTTNLAPARDVELALLHHKLGPDLAAKIDDGIARGQHYLGAIEYRFLQACLQHLADVELLCEHSRLADGAAALQAAGHLI